MKLPIMPGGASTGFSPHRIQAWQSCPRYAYMRYIRNLRLRRDKPFRKLATLCHYALAWYWAGRMDPWPQWYADLRESFGASALKSILDYYGQGYPKEIQQAIAVFRYYREIMHDQPWEPLSVEEELSATIGEIRRAYWGADAKPTPFDDVRVTCRLDLLVRTNGQKVLVDHKTNGRSWNGGDGLARWKDDGEYALHQQMLLDMHLVRIKHGDVRFPVISRVKRVPPFDHDAQPLPVPALAYEEILDTIVDVARIEKEWLQRASDGERVQPHFGPACYGRYGPCDYYNFCRASTKRERRMVYETELREGDPTDLDSAALEAAE